MEAKNKLEIKIKRLFRRAGHPRFWHHMGPKKFETWMLCFGLIIRQVYKLSYRRAMKFLDEYYHLTMHWTTLQKAAKRLPKSLWQLLLQATISRSVPLAALDGTGMSRTNASQHYLRRIDRDGRVERPVQALCMIDVKKRKFLSASFFAQPKGEVRKAPQVIRQCKTKPDVLLMDKGFDAEWLHQWLKEHGTFSIAPARSNCRRGMHRKLMQDCMDWQLYWQRNLVETLFSALKRLFGSTISSKHIKTQTAELFCRLIAYNVGYRLQTFSTEPEYTQNLN
jgi:transposase